MNKAMVTGALGGAAAVGMLALGVFAGRMSEPEPKVIAAPAATMDRAAVEGIVRDYLVANPELIETMQAALETKREAEQKKAAMAAIAESGDAIFKDAADPVIGNPNGSVTVVEFFDYNCGYCKRALEDMNAMVKADPDLRFVLKEFPILGPDSQKAAVVAAAFNTIHPEKYGEFHQALMGTPGRATEDAAIKAAVALGADETALREKMKDPAIPASFARTYELANRLAITGTPSYVVGDEMIFGALGQEVLTEKVANVRTCQKATC